MNKNQLLYFLKIVAPILFPNEKDSLKKISNEILKEKSYIGSNKASKHLNRLIIIQYDFSEFPKSNAP